MFFICLSEIAAWLDVLPMVFSPPATAKFVVSLGFAVLSIYAFPLTPSSIARCDGCYYLFCDDIVALILFALLENLRFGCFPGAAFSSLLLLSAFPAAISGLQAVLAEDVLCILRLSTIRLLSFVDVKSCTSIKCVVLAVSF